MNETWYVTDEYTDRGRTGWYASHESAVSAVMNDEVAWGTPR